MALLFFLHGGPWGPGAGPGAGGWDGPHFPFFPLFGLFPLLFWGGLLFFLFTRISRGRMRHGRGWHGGGGMHRAPAASGPAPAAPTSPHGPAWPDLDPAGSVQRPSAQPKGADLEKRGEVEYV